MEVGGRRSVSRARLWNSFQWQKFRPPSRNPVGHSFLDHCYTALAQQTDHSLARDPGKKGSIRDRRKDNTILSHEDVGGGQFGYIAQHVANDRIVEAPGVGLEKRASIVGIETSGFSIDRHRVLSRPPIGRQT